MPVKPGCATGNHLHFGVTRVTNTVDWYQHSFWSVLGTNPSAQGFHGDNSYAVRVESYGWAAPQGVDPWGLQYRNSTDDYSNHLGAWSIYLWSSPSQQPPNTKW
jgi:hypothetical protein